eukprot:COSAG02_NODE_40788_length_401_cov_1.119205_1_plen_28_part_01
MGTPDYSCTEMLHVRMWMRISRTAEVAH